MEPFLTYVGGKRKLAAHIFKESDFENIHTYVEPFVGGLGSFLYVYHSYGHSIKKFVLSDNNVHLINMYRHVRDHVDTLVEMLQTFLEAYDDSREGYMVWRDRYNAEPPVTLLSAVLFILLNKKSYRGVHKTNKQGDFNVPPGPRPIQVSLEAIRNVSRVLNDKRVFLSCKEFHINIVTCSNPSTLVYLDPPYLGTFSRYGTSSFKLRDHYKMYKALIRARCAWILSCTKSDWYVQKYVCEDVRSRSGLVPKDADSCTKLEAVCRSIRSAEL